MTATHCTTTAEQSQCVHTNALRPNEVEEEREWSSTAGAIARRLHATKGARWQVRPPLGAHNRAVEANVREKKQHTGMKKRTASARVSRTTALVTVEHRSRQQLHCETLLRTLRCSFRPPGKRRGRGREEGTPCSPTYTSPTPTNVKHPRTKGHRLEKTRPSLSPSSARSARLASPSYLSSPSPPHPTARCTPSQTNPKKQKETEKQRHATPSRTEGAAKQRGERKGKPARRIKAPLPDVGEKRKRAITREQAPGRTTAREDVRQLGPSPSLSPSKTEHPKRRCVLLPSRESKAGKERKLPDCGIWNPITPAWLFEVKRSVPRPSSAPPAPAHSGDRPTRARAVRMRTPADHALCCAPTGRRRGGRGDDATFNRASYRTLLETNPPSALREGHESTPPPNPMPVQVSDEHAHARKALKVKSAGESSGEDWGVDELGRRRAQASKIRGGALEGRQSKRSGSSSVEDRVVRSSGAWGSGPGEEVGVDMRSSVNELRVQSSGVDELWVKIGAQRGGWYGRQELIVPSQEGKRQKEGGVVLFRQSLPASRGRKRGEEEDECDETRTKKRQKRQGAACVYVPQGITRIAHKQTALHPSCSSNGRKTHDPSVRPCCATSTRPFSASATEEDDRRAGRSCVNSAPDAIPSCTSASEPGNSTGAKAAWEKETETRAPPAPACEF
ncbi:hypothetical protein C8R45DRAFT_928086 [Mycena sanguinolenta]|nr:hypothetical protein C8R45DRAFT_928086 [Mycena sanguinolenta]